MDAGPEFERLCERCQAGHLQPRVAALVAWVAGAFITVPMSFFVDTPSSAISDFTARRTSSSVICFGMYWSRTSSSARSFAERSARAALAGACIALLTER